MPTAQQITKMLRDELALQTRHCKLLEAQQRALLACDRPRFLGLQEEHALMVSLIEAQEAARKATFCNEDGTRAKLTDLLETLPERNRSAVVSLRDELRRTLENVQQISKQNEQLIKNELDYIAFSLDLFVEAGRKGDGTYYGPPSKITQRLLLDRCA